ncbi:hypothetical protein C3L33_03186, partial [Rhododendron williamsianum]
MMRNNDHCLNFSIPDEIAENLNEFFPDFGDLSHEEVFQHQESVYQSLKGNDSNKERKSDHGQSSDSSQGSRQDCESSRRASFDSQLALDEALAWSLQDLEDGFDDFNISESTSAATGTSRQSLLSFEFGVVTFATSIIYSHAHECFYTRGALRAKGSRPADGLCICMVVQCDDSVICISVGGCTFLSPLDLLRVYNQCHSNTSNVVLTELKRRKDFGKKSMDFWKNREVSSRETPTTSINQTTSGDAIDPDNMTYEQLQSLGESVGVENKGLSEGLLARLPKFKIRTGIFSKKKIKEE